MSDSDSESDSSIEVSEYPFSFVRVEKSASEDQINNLNPFRMVVVILQ